MAEYVPTPVKWVRDQIDLYERSGGTEGTELGGRPVIIVTHQGNKTGAIRKTALMRVMDGDSYVLVGSRGGAPKNPVWVYNLRASANVEIRDMTEVHAMRVREVEDAEERARVLGARGRSIPALRGLQEQDLEDHSGLHRRASLSADGEHPATRRQPPSRWPGMAGTWRMGAGLSGVFNVCNSIPGWPGRRFRTLCGAAELVHDVDPQAFRDVLAQAFDTKITASGTGREYGQPRHPETPIHRPAAGFRVLHPVVGHCRLGAPDNPRLVENVLVANRIAAPRHLDHRPNQRP